MILFGFVEHANPMKPASFVMPAILVPTTRDTTCPFTTLKREDAATAAIPMRGIRLGFVTATAQALSRLVERTVFQWTLSMVPLTLSDRSAIGWLEVS